ncbi:MAG: aldose 1-epimerase family protein [Bacteroidia bacterium]|nr:aldose 1-epimerase family protein [Bacteroidia bacterium]
MSLLIQNKYLKAQFSNIGAELISLRYRNKELIWNADPPWKRHAPILFPIVGKLKDNTFFWKDNSYTLFQHGFARDVEWLCTYHSDTTIEFELTDTEMTFQNYPFHFSLIAEYQVVENTLEIFFRVFNPYHDTLPFSIGYHPAFCLHHQLPDYQLNFFPEQNELLCTKLKDGLITNQRYTIPLSNSALQLEASLFQDDAIVLENNFISEIELWSLKDNFSISVKSNNVKNWGVWTKLNCNEFICIEPWLGVADNENHNQKLEQKKDIILLPPYQSFEWKIIIEIKNKL